MGLVTTRPRLAEDMHRRGEASEGTLPKATRRARERVRSPYQAGAEVLPMWECCQFQCCQFPIGDWNWLMRGPRGASAFFTLRFEDWKQPEQLVKTTLREARGLTRPRIYPPMFA